jgi:demethylmenaquinone methyltransferase / 2-methoxy-6-polyprenyl-1,4-benzoquinol methylase
MEPALGARPLRKWSDEERIQSVKKIFNTITPRYDLLNRIMSAGQDVRWRKFAVSRLPLEVRDVLDVATGTGDLAIEIARSRTSATVYGIDFVEKMMRLAAPKTVATGFADRIYYSASDAMRLPFEDNRFDAATTAFGIRNMPDRLTALKEMSRVVKPGGKIIVLEMTFPKSLKLRKFFTWYLNKIIPILGAIISGNAAAYRYLPDSIQDFLTPDQLTDLFTRAGLKEIKTFPLTLGLTYVHEGLVP